MALSGPAASAWADSPIKGVEADYHYSTYSEDDLDTSKGLAGGETSRYEIQMHQFSLRAPVGERWDVGIDMVHETMSGASPQYVVPDAAGKPIQVMSGASIDDQRNDLLVKWNRYFDNGRLGLSSGYSSENDYRAINLGVDGETHFNEGNTTLSVGLGMSVDAIEPTDANLFATRPDDETKQSYSVLLGLSQILNRATLLQTSVTYKHSRGYLSDPYKSMFVVGGTFLPDERPDVRNQLSWLSRFRGHVRELQGTLHADYQFHIDDWGISSHTFELAWYQSLWDTVQIVPSLRYYSQSQAFFYAPFYDADRPDGLRSSDYRLSPYGALSWGIKADAQFHDWPFQMNGSWGAMFSWERYLSSGSFALGGVAVENPGLVSFHLFSFSLRARF